MLGPMRVFVSILAAAVASPLLLSPAPAGAKTVFHAVCGNLRGQRVDMDPDGGSKKEDWKYEFYKSGPPPEGVGTLEFVAEDTDTDHIIIKWTRHEARAVPVAFRSHNQISLADVDEFGIWIFTLYPRAGKVMVTRQTANVGPGAIGALLVGNCDFEAE